jgi:transposase-like protein
MKCSRKLGGYKKVVEIDEAKFGKSKYHRRRYVKGQWVFGGIERGTNNTFLVPVEKRDTATLLAVLEEWVHPNTTIVSDCWSAYKDLPEKTMFYHFTVNHSKNFVDPDTGGHTNTIERTWRDVRSTIPRYGVRKAHFVGYLAEYQFKRRYERGTRLHHFFKAAASLYPPKPLEQ